MCNALRLYFRREVIGRPQVTVQTVFKINFDECRKIHTHFSSHQKICVKQIVSSRRASNERPY